MVPDGAVQEHEVSDGQEDGDRDGEGLDRTTLKRAAEKCLVFEKHFAIFVLRGHLEVDGGLCEDDWMLN